MAKSQQGEKVSRRKGFTDEEIEYEEARNGELAVHELLTSKVRYFIDGAVIGSRGFVDGVISKLNGQKYWPKPRKTKSSRCEWSKSRNKSRLWTLRCLPQE